MNIPSDEEKKRIRLIVIAALVILPVVLLWSSLTVTIKSGHAGLVFHTFGTGVNTDTEAISSGFHIKAPWDKIYEYEIRQQELFENLEVLSSNLLKIKMDMTVFYQPIYDKLGYLETERGSRYKEKVIQPAMRSVAREVIAQYLPEEFNTTKLEPTLNEVSNGSGSETGRQRHGTFFGNDLFKTTDHTLVVFGRV
jgi:regulator of protease activity HflC (stomatin/prohibitin superfamily)